MNLSILLKVLVASFAGCIISISLATSAAYVFGIQAEAGWLETFAIVGTVASAVLTRFVSVAYFIIGLAAMLLGMGWALLMMLVLSPGLPADTGGMYMQLGGMLGLLAGLGYTWRLLKARSA